VPRNWYKKNLPNAQQKQQEEGPIQLLDEAKVKESKEAAESLAATEAADAVKAKQEQEAQAMKEAEEKAKKEAMEEAKAKQRSRCCRRQGQGSRDVNSETSYYHHTRT
jgi:fused signal recognition particle receptor